jgi:hypothetical protein
MQEVSANIGTAAPGGRSGPWSRRSEAPGGVRDRISPDLSVRLGPDLPKLPQSLLLPAAAGALLPPAGPMGCSLQII